jgi:hypothetical protein
MERDIGIAGHDSEQWVDGDEVADISERCRFERGDVKPEI